MPEMHTWDLFCGWETNDNQLMQEVSPHFAKHLYFSFQLLTLRFWGSLKGHPERWSGSERHGRACEPRLPDARGKLPAPCARAAVSEGLCLKASGSGADGNSPDVGPVLPATKKGMCAGSPGPVWLGQGFNHGLLLLDSKGSQHWFVKHTLSHGSISQKWQEGW